MEYVFDVFKQCRINENKKKKTMANKCNIIEECFLINCFFFLINYLININGENKYSVMLIVIVMFNYHSYCMSTQQKNVVFASEITTL